MEPLPEELDCRVHSELRHDERLIWTGRPKPSRFMWSSIPIFLFGIPWTAFAVFWMAMASRMLFDEAGGNRPEGVDVFFTCFPLFGVPFVLIGLGMLSSPFWMYRSAQHTCYALTNQRAIIWAAGWFGGIEVRSFKAADLVKLTRREYADGSGDLVFEVSVTEIRDNDSYLHFHRTVRGFLGIENVREVEELVQRTLLAAK
ncbi:MAG: hypothetical protein WHU94_14100 [Thermogemmata sp.]|jgi:hypothetical protein